MQGTCLPVLLLTVPVTGTRNPLTQPFSSTSIWNMPIGTGAVYVAANLETTDPSGATWIAMPGADQEIIILEPTAPLTPIYYSSAGWTSGANRCVANSPQRQLADVPIPESLVVPSHGNNDSATYLLADGQSFMQSQPLARCMAAGYGTSLVVWPPQSIYGDGIQGAHGGSGLSAFGGDLRVGELRPGGQPPHHVLKMAVDATVDDYACTTMTQCYTWPAVAADDYAIGWYGSRRSTQPASMVPGALLAIPANVNIASLGLETPPAQMLAWTLQNYGAYIDDDTYKNGVDFDTENGPTDGSFITQFARDWGFSFTSRVRENTPWMRDVQRLLAALSVVTNNGPNSIGGGGTPLQPLAPPLQ